MLTAISVFCAAEPDLSCPAGGGHIALHLQVMTTCPVIFGAIFCSTVRGARRTSIIHRQGYAAGKHYSSSGVRGGQALFIVRGTRRTSIIHCARRIFLSKALSRQMPALSPGCWDLSIGLQRVHFRDGLKTGQNLTTKISKWTYKNWITASLQIFNLK